MRIVYHVNPYISYSVTAAEYAACLAALGHELLWGLEHAGQADVVILHEEPTLYEHLYASFPVLRRCRVIACCVWENEILPPFFREPLGLVNEIWTPSSFSASSMLPHFAGVRVLPHVARRIAFSKEDAAWARQRLTDDPDVFRFFSVIDLINPRKNFEGLLGAFYEARKVLGERARLVLKQYRMNIDLGALPGVVSIAEELSRSRMAALHALCDAYVSAHHAEGWGLGLSDSMCYGKPVIATGYSGNMEFMNRDNSFPVSYVMAPVSDLMRERFSLFTPDMRWADVDIKEMAATMVMVARGRGVAALKNNAAAISRRFGPPAIARRLAELLTGGKSGTTFENG